MTDIFQKWPTTASRMCKLAFFEDLGGCRSNAGQLAPLPHQWGKGANLEKYDLCWFKGIYFLWS